MLFNWAPVQPLIDEELSFLSLKPLDIGVSCLSSISHFSLTTNLTSGTDDQGPWQHSVKLEKLRKSVEAPEKEGPEYGWGALIWGYRGEKFKGSVGVALS